MLIDNNSLPPAGIAGHNLSPEAAEAIAIRMIFDRDPVALACHALGIACQVQTKPLRLHPDDLDYIVRQVGAYLSLAEETAQVARVAQKSPGRYTGTALGDRAAAGREHDPYPIYTHEELADIQKQQEGHAA